MVALSRGRTHAAQTGRAGRLIVRKLLLRGFRVAVLVRSLSSNTLSLLGSQVSYAYGDMTNYDSLLSAMDDVDKVVFAADASARGGDTDEELRGLKNVARAFQDTRTFMYGEAEATKRSLFKFSRDSDLGRWEVESELDAIDERLASAGLGRRPSVAYWKRSDAHRNGVFVGTVFDAYLGSALVACDLTGAPLELGESSGLLLKAIGDGQTYTFAVRTTAWVEQGIEYYADFEAPAGGFVSARLPFSSFVAYRDGRRVDDPKYRELDRRQITGLALAYFPQRNGPDNLPRDGAFYLSVAHVKAYRRRDEPEFVYVSRAERATAPAAAAPAPAAAPASATPAVAPAEHAAVPATVATAGEVGPTATAGGKTVEGGEAAAAEKEARLEATARTKRKCEAALEASGLTYFIVRPTSLDNEATVGRRHTLVQGSEASPARARGRVSRAFLADLVVEALLDPRACNVACTLCESRYTASGQAGGAKDEPISSMLEVLTPNRL